MAWAFTTFRGANWFPLTRLSWMVDAELFGLSPRALHATSLLLHVATSLLLFIAFRRLTGELWPSAFVAAVVAVVVSLLAGATFLQARTIRERLASESDE